MSSTRSTPRTCSGIAAPRRKRLGWNLKALALAEAATDPRARGWRASLYHNIGWTYFDDGDAGNGARLLAEGARRARGDGQRRVDPRREMDGRARLPRRRSPRRRGGDAEERSSAELEQRSAKPDGYVYEELAEIALARGDARRGAPLGGESARGAQGRSPGSRRTRRRGLRGSPRSRTANRRARQAVNPQKRRAIFERLRAANPNPHIGARRTGRPFELLVAVVLSAQATDKGVNKATAKLFPVAEHAGRDRRSSASKASFPTCSRSGSIATRRRTSSRSQRSSLREHGGKVPADARGARSAARRGPQDCQRRAERRVRAADDRRRHAHLPRRQSHRASRRARRPRRSSASSLKFVPDEFKLHAHHWLILHGRYVCVARVAALRRNARSAISANIRHKTGVAALMFNPSRDEARRFLIDAWTKAPRARAAVRARADGCRS